MPLCTLYKQYRSVEHLHYTRLGAAWESVSIGHRRQFLHRTVETDLHFACARTVLRDGNIHGAGLAHSLLDAVRTA